MDNNNKEYLEKWYNNTKKAKEGDSRECPNCHSIMYYVDSDIGLIWACETCGRYEGITAYDEGDEEDERIHKDIDYEILDSGLTQNKEGNKHWI